MTSLMYKKDREPLSVTDNKEGRQIMKDNGWSDTPEKKKETPKKVK